MGLDYKYDANFINLFKRNFLMVIHGLALAASQFYLPLPIVHTLSFSSPIFVFIIDYFENGVRVSKSQIYCLLLAVMGMICTVNSELVRRLLDDNYEITTDFKNYISLDPYHFTIYSLVLMFVMFLWAYAILRVRNCYKNHHSLVNFHLGLMFLISCGFLYPIKVTQPSSLVDLGNTVIWSGIPLVIAQSCFGAGIAHNRKTGQIAVLTGIPILLSYVIAYFRYGEMPDPFEMIGSGLIMIGVYGVINCS